MSARRVFARARENQLAAHAERVERDTYGEFKRGADAATNALQRRYCDELLARCPRELVAIRDRIMTSKKWLEANPHRPLHPWYAQRLHRYDALFARISRGHVAPDPAKCESRSSEAATRAKRERQQTLFPDWMSDPTLLPKRPPGRP